MCETLFQNIGCYLQFCITKKLRPVNNNLSKVHFFHILSAHAKGLTAKPGLIGPSRAPANINVCVCVCVCVCVFVHWLCARDDQTGGAKAWPLGREKGMAMQSLGVAIR